MRKRLICIILASSMIFSLAACVNINVNTTLGSIENEEIVEPNTRSTNAEPNASSTDYTTGNPWINSNYMQNVIVNPDISLKDHFDLAINGEWVKNNPLEPGKSYKSYLMSFEDELNNRLTTIITDDSYSNNHDAELVQTYYNSFLDWDERDKTSLDSFVPYLAKIEAISSYDDLINYYRKGEVTLSNPIGFGISENPLSSDVYCAEISKPAVYLNDPADYMDIENMSEYTQLTYDCAKEKVFTVLSYCGYSSEEINSIFDGAIEYETLISKYVYNKSESNIQDTQIKVARQIVSKDEIKNYRWFSIITAAFESIGITDIDTYHLSDKMDYFEKLDSIITEENIGIIKDYLIAHAASSSIKYLDKNCYYSFLDVSNRLNGSTGYKEENQYALDATNSSLGWPLSKLYVEKHVTEEDKENVKKIINEIIDKYKIMLESEEFLSEATKKEAVNKLNHIRINCMYPDNWDDYDYSELKLSTSDNYFDNYIKLSLFEKNKLAEDFYKPVNKNEWVATPIGLDAYYNPQNNSINILPGLIGDVLYNEDMPKEEVLAKLGSVVGHEISHAFDPNGATYDADGNLKDWWTKEDYANFNERISKLVKYYDNIKIWDDFYSDGELIKTEACADMAGVASVLMIAKDIENFDYDLFFKSYARIWASNWTPEFMYYMGSYNPHPLTYLRVNVTVAQFDEFYDTYDIKEGDGMYIAPEDRVKIW